MLNSVRRIIFSARVQLLSERLDLCPRPVGLILDTADAANISLQQLINIDQLLKSELSAVFDH